MTGRIVLGTGSRTARIVLVGEAPGEDEDREGRPFVGKSGHLLDDMLANVGIDRRQCFVDNVMHIRPPSNDFRIFYVDKSQRQQTDMLMKGIAELKETIRSIKPNVTVALGGEALRALTGLEGIEKWRGSILESPVGKVVPTYHPAYVGRVYSSRVLVEHDLKRALEESASPLLHLPQHTLEVNPSYERVIEYLGSILLRRCRVAFDIETLGKRVRCIALADSSLHALCIPFVSNRTPSTDSANRILIPHTGGLNSHWPEEEETEIIGLLEEVLGSPSIPLIAQNFPFDATLLLTEFGIVCRALHLDTMIAQHCLYSELPKRLEFLGSIYTRVPYWKDYDSRSDMDTWVYNCKDAVVTFEVATVLEKEMRGG